MSLACLAVFALLQEPTGRSAIGRAPVVAGNQVSARERALDDAFRQIVDRGVGETLDPQVRAAHEKALRALAGRARSYVGRYRVLRQGAAGETYEIEIEADLDLTALRRDVEKLVPAGVAPAGPTDVSVTLEGPLEAGEAIVAALAAAGVKAAIALAGRPVGTQVRLMARASATGEGPLRGIGKVAVRCTLDLALDPPRPGLAADGSRDTPRGFGVDEAAARRDCFSHLAAARVFRLADALPTGVAPADGRVVILEADVVEPGAVVALLKILKSIAGVTGADLRRFQPGRAEIRVTTRLPAPTLATAAGRDGTGRVVLGNVVVAGDRITLRAGLVSMPAPGASP